MSTQPTHRIRAWPHHRAWWALVAGVLAAHLALLAWVWPTHQPTHVGSSANTVQTVAVGGATVQTAPHRAAQTPKQPEKPKSPERSEQKEDFYQYRKAQSATALEEPKAASPTTPRAAPAPLARATEQTPATEPAAAPPAFSATTTDTSATQTLAAVAAHPDAVPTQASPPPATTAPGKLKWPSGSELRYDVKATRKGLSLSAQSVLRWQPTATAYQARLDIKALLLGQRSQTSVGALDLVNGLTPTRYGDKNRSEQATHFDRSRTPPTLRFSANTPDIPLQPHTQDRLSVLLQLSAMFAGDTGRFGPGSKVRLHTAGPRDADVWQFDVGTTTPLTLPWGTLEAVHLVREALHPYDNRIELWLAPELEHLPVRILWTQANGDVVDQQLSRHTPLTTDAQP